VPGVHSVLADAGALIALLDRNDAEHERAVATLRAIRGPLLSVWPAFTEAMHLLGDTWRGPETLCDMVVDGALVLVEPAAADLTRIKTLMQKYRDVPMDFADAALVCASEREQLTTIFTFDRHFTIYRLPRRVPFTVMPKPSKAVRAGAS
jgi:predicted nucleic acid-binding protein